MLRMGALKAGARALGVDDCPFVRGEDERTWLIGVLMRGGVVEKVLTTDVRVDGSDATQAVVSMHDEAGKEARVIFTHGTVVAGFNPLNLREIWERTGAPVVAVLERPPRWDLVRRAMMTHGLGENLRVLEENPPYAPVATPRGEIFCASVGLDRIELWEVVIRWQMESKIPEPLRLADLIGRSVIRLARRTL